MRTQTRPRFQPKPKPDSRRSAKNFVSAPERPHEPVRVKPKSASSRSDTFGFSDGPRDPAQLMAGLAQTGHGTSSSSMKWSREVSISWRPRSSSGRRSTLPRRESPTWFTCEAPGCNEPDVPVRACHAPGCEVEPGRRQRRWCERHRHSGRARFKTAPVFTIEILPALRTATISQIAAANGLSHLYRSLIRLGKRLPHPRHWGVLRRRSRHASACTRCSGRSRRCKELVIRACCP